MAWSAFVLAVVALVASAGLLALSSAVPAGSGASADSSSTGFEIPVGRIGDEVDYLVLLDGRLPLNYGPFGEPPGDMQRSWFGMRIEGLGEALDATMTPHDAVLLAATEEREGQEAIHSSVAVDLAARAKIQVYAGEEGLTDAWVEYGPQFEDPYDVSLWPLGVAAWGGDAELWMYGYGGATAFEFQGSLLEVGQRFTDGDLVGRLGQTLSTGGTPYFYVTGLVHDEPISFEYSREVTAAGRLAGYDVVAVETRITLDYVRSFNGLVPERHWHEQQVMTVWLSPDVPYPIRIERTMWRESEEPADYGSDPRHGGYTNDGNQNYTVVQDLVRYAPGDEPIPWRQAESDPFSEANPNLERAPPGTLHPVSGRTSRLAHSFDEAFHSVQTDPLLTGFREWKASHPDHYLIGAEFLRDVPRNVPPPYPLQGSPAFDSRNLGTWTLIFAFAGEAGPSDQAFVVASTLMEAEGVVNSEWGATYLDDDLGWGGFGADDLVDSPMTFGYVIGLYDGLKAPSGADPSLYRLDWGYSAIPYPWVPAVAEMYVQGNAGRLQQGISAEGTATEPYPEGAQEDGVFAHTRKYVYVDADGNVTDASYEQWVDWYPLVRQDLPEEGLGPIQVQQREDRGVAAQWPDHLPSSVVFLVVPASLLSILLFAYFFPLLRYLGASLLHFVPLYAREHGDAVVQHATRSVLVGLIVEEPGITPSELHGAVGGSFGGVVYHLRVLQRNGVVSSVRDGRYKRFFKAGSTDWSKRRGIGVLRNKRTRSFYKLVLERPGVARPDVAKRLGVAPPALYLHERRLAQAGLIDRGAGGKPVRYFPVAEAASGSASA